MFTSMKTEFLLLGYVIGKSTPSIYARNGNFIGFNGLEVLKLAKRWQTRGGVERFIEAEQKAGSVWGYLILPVSPAGSSQAASSLGKLGAGIPRTITPEESQARRERLAAARANRWP